MTNFRRVAVTGHRLGDFDDTEAYMVANWLELMAKWLTEERGMTEIISGMALGADTWWAQQVESSDARLSAYVPFWGQKDKWPIEDKAEWFRLLALATDVKVFGRTYPYEPSNFFARNDAMIEDCDLMLAVWDPAKTSGGTYNCFKKYQETGKPWFHFDYKQNKVNASGENAW